MYLKRVNIQGFKSFANKTTIELNHSVTAIVGPNGSGKSNITDAIMWVLGEQSVKNLRGNKMEDVIFSGTGNKRALGFAEVEAVFDNSDKSIPIDFDEVSIFRRMYRSGESEFKINGEKVRLKDIHNLFMDTGIGREGYSLIGQGKIDNILSNKSEDRRGVFEEAAGITKFKSKKKEALNSLKRTNDNLQRLEDIHIEISRQEESLKIESEKALTYKELFEKLRRYDLIITGRKINNYIEKIEKIKSESEDNNSNLSEKEEELAHNRKEIEELNSKLSEIELKIEDLNLKNLEETSNREKLNSQIELLKERISNLNIKLSTIDVDLEKENTNKDIYLKKLKDIEPLLAEEKDKVNNIDSLIGEKNKEQNNISSEIKELNNKLSENEEKSKNTFEHLSKSNSRMDFLNSMEEDKNGRILNINKNRDLYLNEIEKSKTVLKDQRINLDDLNAKMSELNTSRASIEQDREKYENELNDIKTLQSDLHMSKSKAAAKRDALINLKDNFEGYGASVKSFMKSIKRERIFSGVVGPVGDNFTTQAEYEVALNIAFGFSMQNIIIDTVKESESIFNYIKKNKFGRVTLLPIDRIKGRGLKSLTDLNGYNIIGYAIDLVQCDESLKDIYSILLGNTIVVKDYKSALKLDSALNNANRIVTLQGESINRGGSISGGSIQSKSVGVINRTREINSLIKDIDNFNKKIIDSEKQLINFQDKLKECDNNLSSLKSKEEELKVEASNLNTNIERLNLSIKNAEKELQNSEEEIEFLKNSIDKDATEKTETSELIIKLQDVLQDLKAENEELNSAINKNSADYQSLTHEIKDLEIKRVELLNNFSNLEYEQKRLKTSVIDGDKNHDRLIETKNLIIKEIEEKNLEQLRLQEALTKDETQSLNKEIEDLRNKRNTFKLSVDEVRKISDELVEAIYNIKNNLSKSEVELDKLNEFAEIEKARLINDYGTIDYPVDLNENATKKDLKILKENISLLGDVNLGSIAEYEEVSERLNFINGQLSDLNEAKVKIEKIIRDLDREMIKAFTTSFEEINTYFSEIFVKLFNGGRAEIVLEEGDILEAGIEIKAQPPGKKFQSLSLLSGGERSLTAVALLFALLKTRPAPFCILDEIDASLDDANITRYVDYLKTIEKIQFIMITHRKISMEIADILYGVTMEEKGVSKIVSVSID